ncbi:MAG: 50S ribosomal protein L25/general stress protein Ctc [Longimicrobiales bacterium]|nr:50S ribosomal protein L25/general stress protein Ctc [Longimicrobiales bacterium]
MTATTATLTAEAREGTGKGAARKLRQNGKIPAVVYGRDADTLHLTLDTLEAEHLFRRISVDNTIVELALDGEKEPIQTLVREIQTHPWKANLLHVDFYRIEAGVAVDVDVPVHLVGTPVGVKMGGGVLEQVIHDLPIRCIPSKIPEVIEVDVTEMDVNDVLHIYDLEFEEGVEVTIPGERTICSVSIPRALDEILEAEEEALEEAEALEEGEEPVEGEEPAEGEEAPDAEAEAEEDED